VYFSVPGRRWVATADPHVDITKKGELSEMSNPRTHVVPNGESLMLSVEKVARLLDLSERHVYRLEQKKLMPAAVRLGASVRWPRKSIEHWIEEGCQPTLAV
jgi:excisionase family DNA binding protein